MKSITNRVQQRVRQKVSVIHLNVLYIFFFSFFKYRIDTSLLLHQCEFECVCVCVYLVCTCVVVMQDPIALQTSENKDFKFESEVKWENG